MIAIAGVVPEPHQPDTVDPLPGFGISHADVSERLLAEFRPTLGLGLVSELPRCCRVQLAARPVPSSPSALEGMARAMLAAVQVPSPRRRTS